MKIKLAVASAVLGSLIISGCASASNLQTDVADTDKLNIVATFSIVADIAREIGGDRVSVHSIVPVGTDPHEYQPLPEDIAKTVSADVIVWNGLNMELGDGWFLNLLEISDRKIDDANVIEASAGVQPKYLTAGASSEHEVNPHAFLDPTVGMAYVANILDGLIAIDPAGEDTYTKHATEYTEELVRLDSEYRVGIESIPKAKRVLVTSENAFQYLNDQYGIQGLYIWAIDTGDLGSPEQISTLVEELRRGQVPGLFVESNVDRRPMETVSGETGIPIVGTLYSDELGRPGDESASYLGMLKHNLNEIINGLSK